MIANRPNTTLDGRSDINLKNPSSSEISFRDSEGSQPSFDKNSSSDDAEDHNEINYAAKWKG